MTEDRKQEIYKWWDTFVKKDSFVEIRILGGKVTYSGYYKNVDNLINDVDLHEREGAVYFTINSINDACYERPQSERMLGGMKVNTTSDNEVIGYDYIFLDIDCERVANTNATDDEKSYAHSKAQEIFKFLKSEGFNEPIVVDSANGYHIYIPCGIPNNEEGKKLVKRFILAMSLRFGDERIKIDQVVSNPARIAKLPSTFSYKGSSSSTNRPQRMCKMLYVPSEIKVNDTAYIKKIANIYPEEQRPTKENNYSTERFDLESFISRYNIPVKSKIQVADGTRYLLEHCLFNEQHKGKDAILFQANNGAIGYFCFHNSCSGYKWRDVRLKYEPDAYTRKFSRYESRKYDFYKREEEVVQQEVESEEKGKKWIQMGGVKRSEINPDNYVPSGIQQIDDLMIGFKKKNLSIWSGYRGSGKSSLLNMLILNAAQKGYKSALWSGEMTDEEIKTWLYLQAAGKAYNKVTRYNNYYRTPDNVCSEIDKWIDKYFWLYNNEYSSDFNVLESEIRECVKENGVDVVLLDNLMMLEYGDDNSLFSAQKELMKRLSKLSKELNIHIHLVAHPNKSGTFLRPNNISGSGHIPDIAQNIFILHRINRDFNVNAKEFLSSGTIADILTSECSNCIEICKCRDKGSAADTFVKLYFETESNRLKNDIAENIRYNWEDDGSQREISYEPYYEGMEEVDYYDDLPE